MALTFHSPAKMVSTLAWFCCCHCTACCLSAAAAADSSRASSQLQVLEMSLLGAFSEDSLVLPSQKPKLEDRCVGHPENKPFALLWCAGAVGLAVRVFLQPGHASSAGRFSTMVTLCILSISPLSERHVLERLHEECGLSSPGTGTSCMH